MDSEVAFYRRVDDWLGRFLEAKPSLATQAGDHRWDDRLADNSAEGLRRLHDEMSAALEQFEAMDLSSSPLDVRIDRTLVLHIVKSLIREYEQVEGRLRDPGLYLGEALQGTFLLIVLEFAPLPQRLRSALGRVQQVPRLLREGQANLVPARVPRIWAEIALEQAEGAPGLFLGLLPALAAEAAPELQADLAAAGQAAAEALQGYACYLKDTVLPLAEGNFAAGRSLFDEMLRQDHMVGYDADSLLETGWRLFHETRGQMEALAGDIDPSKTVRELLEESKRDHPTAEDLLSAYERAMAEARQFVVDHAIATIPQGERLRVVETPPYLRSTIPYAAYLLPGILEHNREGIFLVTPVDPDSPAEEQEQRLKGHNWAKLLITALHEAYPGHHLQLVWANRHESIPRRLGSALSTLFVEGWAFYCEELMEQLGFIAKPVQRLGRLSDQLWRAARIILDVSLHTRGMTVHQAVDFLVTQCQLEPANALAEVRRYTQSPTQPQSYLMGKLAILDLVADYQRAHPGASLRQMHDAILGCGSLPPRLMRTRLFGDGGGQS